MYGLPDQKSFFFFALKGVRKSSKRRKSVSNKLSVAVNVWHTLQLFRASASQDQNETSVCCFAIAGEMKWVSFVAGIAVM